jgi:hypothetical protein
MLFENPSRQLIRRWRIAARRAGIAPLYRLELMGRFPNRRLDLEEPYRLRLSALNQPLTELLMRQPPPAARWRRAP